MPTLFLLYKVKDLNILKPLYEGTGSSILYTKPHLMAWAGPVFLWCCFILALGSVMICMNVVLRKQWMDNEKLSYPLVQLPIAIDNPRNNMSTRFTVASEQFTPLQVVLFRGCALFIGFSNDERRRLSQRGRESAQKMLSS